MEQPSPYKKFLIPGVIILGIVVVGLIVFMKGGVKDQGAALFRSGTLSNARLQTPTTFDINQKNISNVTKFSGEQLPCLVGNTTPQIRVTSPNGGEVFTAGQQITVKWSTCNVQNFPGTNTSAVSILLKQQSTGVRYNLIPSTNPQYGHGNFTQNDGSEVVTLPTISTYPVTPISYGTDFRIMVVLAAPYPPIETNNGAIYDESDNLFTINGPAGVDAYLNTSTVTAYTSPAGDSIGVFVMKFRLKNNSGEDVLFNKSIIAANMCGGVKFSLEKSNGSVVPTTNVNCSLSAPAVQQTATDFILEDGDTEEFTLTVVAGPGFPTGTYRLFMSGARYTGVSTGIVNGAALLPSGPFKTANLFIQ